MRGFRLHRGVKNLPRARQSYEARVCMDHRLNVSVVSHIFDSLKQDKASSFKYTTLNKSSIISHRARRVGTEREATQCRSNWLKPRLPCTPLGSSDDLPTCSRNPSTFSPRTRAPPHRRRLHLDHCLDHRSLHRSLRVVRRSLPVAALRSPPRRRAVAPSQTTCCASLRWPCR